MRYLGIDYGSKRVGLALSDEDGRMAFPYKIIQNDPELLIVINNVCNEEKISDIVLGESKNLYGQPNKIMKEINEFKNKLNSDVGRLIHLEKEFMTTVEARGRGGKEVNNARKTTKVKTAAADASAAALILQRYLDRKNMSK